jgi:hypothetical protein
MIRGLFAAATIASALTVASAVPAGADVGAPVAQPAASSGILTPHTGPYTGAFFDSEQGDYIGQGRTYSFATVLYDGLRSGYPTFTVSSPTDSFQVWVAAPAGQTLVPGVYNGAQRFDFRAPGTPGLDVFGDGRGCNTVAGRFVVDDATYAGDGSVLSFAMQFELHCDGAPPLFGDLSYNSSSAFYARSVSPSVVTLLTAGRLIVAEQITISNTGSATLNPGGYAFSGQDAEDFAVVQDGCSGGVAPGNSCSVWVAYDPPADRSQGTATFYFTDQLAPAGPSGEPDGAGSGRAIAVTGQSLDGYYLVSSAGQVANFGDSPSYGQYQGSLNKQIVGMAMTGDLGGYWLVASDGGIFSYGDAQFYGSTGNISLNKPIVGMATTPDGLGYWMVASDGGIFAYGDAQFYGSTGNIHLNKPIVGMARTPDGLGYWMVASDGGIFAYGDARFYGSTGNISLNKPIVGMATTPDGAGYWMVASDGGIFAFGDAGFYGSTGNINLNKPVVGMATAPDGGGYWLVASDGGVFNFGDAPFLGGAADQGGVGWDTIVPLFP